MGRSPCCSKEGLNRGAWTALEDRILAAYIKAHGEGKWRNLPKRAGLKRCGKSCRLRWLNYLRPDIKRGNISHDEEELIIRLHKLLGNRWSLIAGRLPGRTDNEIKNYWNTTLGKKVKVGVGVGAGAADSSPPESPQSPTAVKKNKSNSKAKRPATVTDRNPKCSSSSQPRLETSPPPPAAIRTKALRCTTVVAPATDSSSLFINKPTTIENQSHSSNSIISKPQSEMQYCTTTQHLKYSHGTKHIVASQNLRRLLPPKLSTDALYKLQSTLSFCQFSGQQMATAGEEMASNADSGKSFARRDQLLEIEAQVQKWWEEREVFRADSLEMPPKLGEKFFGNFPFPYMNGYLHLGHAFSLSKLEFAAAYHRLRGANVLLPFAFHCTGMPIKASADKLCREIQKFGNPPVFPTVEEEKSIDPEPQPEEANQVAPDIFKGKKSKAAAKSGGNMYQWEIMQSYGLSDDEITKFQDPYFWLTYFPPLAVEDLKAFGLGCDWRRTFITTDINPFFDSFVRWQMRKLKKLGKIVKDVRYTIYSPLDGQPCADHDRASGEGVIPQEYTLIKMEVIPPLPSKLRALEGRKVYLAAATLRPETMYGQTNAWVLPEGKYGAFEINETDVFILTERAALNLAYQKVSRVPEMPTCLVELSGKDLIGLPLRSPLAFNEAIYSLPMLSILTDKGTGIVTSVPSDSPDDFMALHDLKSKPAFRAKFGVKDEWVVPFDVIPIISTPEFGDKSAEKVCIDMKIKSQNERQKLEEAKKKIYKGGFYEGTMLAGEYAGMRVQDAKNLIKNRLLELGEAVMYSEPEKKVISRSGDECIVALTDQWYITYGESNWKEEAEKCLASMNLFSEETRHGFEHTLSWLNQWACSRHFGLGTHIPWDEEFLVESLSDSTIYMAYYTVCHMLQKGDMYGSDTSSVKPQQLTDEVWDFLFCSGPYPNSSDIPSLLNKMKQEFEYWYPFDLRVSGKDLIQNHLTFSIYNHAAIFPKHHWPQGFRCNGHIMLNSEKMSKSTGNFRTLRQAIQEFSADATRFSLADAGDGMDDANFVFETANAAILRLTKEIAWMQEVLAAETSLRSGPPTTTYADRVFANEINIAVKITEKNYSEYLFREALKTGFYDLQAARDEYRFSCGTGGMNRDLLWQFMDVQTRLITPICPHYAEYVWKELLKKDGLVIKAGWPEADLPDLTLKKANKYLQDSIVSMRKLLQKQVSGSKKAKVVNVSSHQNKPMVGLIFVNEQYDGWKKECLNILGSKFNSATCSFAPDQEIIEALQKSAIGQEANFKQIQKLCMPFLRFKKDEVIAVGVQALDLKLPFGEKDVLEENLELVKRQLGLERLEILSVADPDAVKKAGSHVSLLNQNPPSPGNLTAIFLSE